LWAAPESHRFVGELFFEAARDALSPVAKRVVDNGVLSRAKPAVVCEFMPGAHYLRAVAAQTRLGAE
jgi:hypothetical protein